MSIISSIQVSLSGILAQQRAIEVTSHNIANVNTPGYHRQEAVLTTLPSIPQPGSLNGTTVGSIGTGVEVDYIRRMQDAYVQQQLQATQQEVGRWSTMSDGLQQIESITAPGKGLDLSSMLDGFFSSWQLLATHPEELSSRLTVRSAAVNLTSTLNTMADQLDYRQTQTIADIQAKTDRLNQLADNLADLNSKIGMTRSDGNNPNDYLDQRDQVLSEMAGLAGVNSISYDEATGIAAINGHALVEGAHAFHLSMNQTPTGIQMVLDDGATVTVGGQMAALIDLNDKIIPSFHAQLDTIASTLANVVNTLHATGVTMGNLPAGNFFAGTTAGSIRIADDIQADAGNIAATTQTGAPGDGSLATDIFGLSNSKLINNQTVNQAAQSLISQVGNAVSTAKTNLEVKSALLEAVQARDQQVGGVSIDEEMANLIVYQRAFQASAHLISTLDEMTQTVLDQLGR